MSYAIYSGVNFKSVTPSDTELLKPFANTETRRCQYVIIGSGGNLAIRNEDGTTQVITGLIAGGQYAISTDQILATGTTATNIIAAFDSESQIDTFQSSSQ